MNIVKSFLPSEVKINSEKDIKEIVDYLVGSNFLVINSYHGTSKAKEYKQNCNINYDLKILLATLS